jgi:hypothetical protein
MELDTKLRHNKKKLCNNLRFDNFFLLMDQEKVNFSLNNFPISQKQLGKNSCSYFKKDDRIGRFSMKFKFKNRELIVGTVYGHGQSNLSYKGEKLASEAAHTVM